MFNDVLKQMLACVSDIPRTEIINKGLPLFLADYLLNSQESRNSAKFFLGGVINNFLKRI